MNIEIVKRAICDALPEHVNISNVEMVDGNGKLSVQITWDVEKASEPEPIKLPSLDSSQALWARPEWWTMDGYCRPFINFDQHVPLDIIAGLPAAYREKMKAEFEKSTQEANKLRAEKTEIGKIRETIDKLNASSIREAEDARILEELAKKITDPTYLQGLKDAVTKPATDVREVRTPEGRVVKRISIPREVNVVAVRGTDQYEKSLIRAGIDPLGAKEMARDNERRFTFEQTKPEYSKQPKTTAEGKIVTPIDLPLPAREPRVPSPNTKEEVAAVRRKIYPGVFRRAEPDGYTTVIVDGKPKVIDGYQKPRTVKNAFEVVAEYKKAVEAYDKRFANVRSPLAPKPNAADKGKRAAPALTAHALPFSHRDRKVTDVEVMFMANEKMAKLTDPPSLLDDLKAIEVKLPPQTKLNRIMFHLRSIKNEILRK